uniref:Glycine zipper 2TM domain-containing protein n=1 Tax=Tanacetum cinerariifolium TaxID=118510 RepID=A0A699GEX7_TANCI|nr:hypothetical protein [Tanacetum cinerariifolium]
MPPPLLQRRSVRIALIVAGLGRRPHLARLPAAAPPGRARCAHRPAQGHGRGRRRPVRQRGPVCICRGVAAAAAPPHRGAGAALRTARTVAAARCRRTQQLDLSPRRSCARLAAGGAARGAHARHRALPRRIDRRRCSRHRREHRAGGRLRRGVDPARRLERSAHQRAGKIRHRAGPAGTCGALPARGQPRRGRHADRGRRHAHPPCRPYRARPAPEDGGAEHGPPVRHHRRAAAGDAGLCHRGPPDRHHQPRRQPLGLPGLHGPRGQQRYRRQARLPHRAAAPRAVGRSALEAAAVRGPGAAGGRRLQRQQARARGRYGTTGQPGAAGGGVPHRTLDRARRRRQAAGAAHHARQRPAGAKRGNAGAHEGWRTVAQAAQVRYCRRQFHVRHRARRQRQGRSACHPRQTHCRRAAFAAQAAVPQYRRHARHRGRGRRRRCADGKGQFGGRPARFIEWRLQRRGQRRQRQQADAGRNGTQPGQRGGHAPVRRRAGQAQLPGRGLQRARRPDALAPVRAGRQEHAHPVAALAHLCARHVQGYRRQHRQAQHGAARRRRGGAGPGGARRSHRAAGNAAGARRQRGSVGPRRMARHAPSRPPHATRATEAAQSTAASPSGKLLKGNKVFQGAVFNGSVAVVVAATLGLSACAGMSNQDKNTAVGAGVGAVAGSVLTGGSAVGAVGGAAVGGVIGNQRIGSDEYVGNSDHALVLDQLVAAAGDGFQPGRIEDLDIAAAVGDELLILQRTGCLASAPGGPPAHGSGCTRQSGSPAPAGCRYSDVANAAAAPCAHRHRGIRWRRYARRGRRAARQRAPGPARDRARPKHRSCLRAPQSRPRASYGLRPRPAARSVYRSENKYSGPSGRVHTALRRPRRALSRPTAPGGLAHLPANWTRKGNDLTCMYADARRQSMAHMTMCGATHYLDTVTTISQGTVMNTPLTPNTSSTSPSSARAGMHPLLLIAAVAVILFCAVGTAAIMGWLPKSNANGDLPAPGAAPLAAAPVAQQEQALPSPAPQQLAAADTAPREPVRATEPAPAALSAPAAPAVCKSCGVVESVRTLEHRAQGSGVGAAGGAILGGLLGNQVGSGHGRQLATVAGAVGGAVAGNQIEGHVKSTQSWQITVRMDNGTKRTFNFTSQPSWHEGDEVKVVNGKLRSATVQKKKLDRNIIDSKIRTNSSTSCSMPDCGRRKTTLGENHALYHRCSFAYPVAAGPGHLVHHRRFHSRSAGRCHHHDPAAPDQWTRRVVHHATPGKTALHPCGGAPFFYWETHHRQGDHHATHCRHIGHMDHIGRHHRCGRTGGAGAKHQAGRVGNQQQGFQRRHPDQPDAGHGHATAGQPAGRAARANGSVPGQERRLGAQGGQRRRHYPARLRDARDGREKRAAAAPERTMHVEQHACRRRSRRDVQLPAARVQRSRPGALQRRQPLHHGDGRHHQRHRHAAGREGQLHRALGGRHLPGQAVTLTGLTGIEYLGGRFQLQRRHRAFFDGDALLRQQGDHARARNPRQEGAVGNGCHHAAVGRHEKQVGGRELGNVAVAVAYHRVIVAALLGGADRLAGIDIQGGRLGVGGRHGRVRAALLGQAGGKPGERRHGGVEQRQCELGLVGHRHQEAGGAEHHGADVQLGVGREAGHAFAHQRFHFFNVQGAGQADALGGGDHAQQVRQQIRQAAANGPRAVEHGRTEPHAVVHRAIQGGVAFGPIAVEPHVDGMVAAAARGGVAHCVAGAVAVPDLGQRGIKIGALGHGVAGAHGHLLGVAVGQALVVLVDVRRQERRGAHRHGHAEQGVAAAVGGHGLRHRAVRIGHVPVIAALAPAAAVGGVADEAAEIDVCRHQRIAGRLVDRRRGAGRVEQIVLALVRDAEVDGALGVADRGAVRAVDLGAERRFAHAVNHRADQATAAARRFVLDRIIVTLGGVTDQVAGAAGHAAMKRVGDVGQGFVHQVVLAAHGDPAQRTVEPHERLAAEQFAVVLVGAGIVAHASLEGVHGRSAMAQVFAATDAQARAGSDAAVHLGAGAVALATAFHDHTGIEQTIHLDRGRRLRRHGQGRNQGQRKESRFHDEQ